MGDEAEYRINKYETGQWGLPLHTNNNERNKNKMTTDIQTPAEAIKTPPTNPFAETTVGESREMPAKMVIYGPPKLGKSRFCAQIEDVFFLDIEGGLAYLDKKVRATPKIKTFDEVIKWLEHILTNDAFKAGTIAIDSADWLESLAIAKIEALHSTKITDKKYDGYAYGNGYLLVMNECLRVITALNLIWEKKGIKAVFIAHSQLKEVTTPLTDPYNRYELKFFAKGFGHKLFEWGDLILFCDKVFHVAEEGMKVSEPKVMILSGNSAAYIGGGRMRLDRDLPLDYHELKKYITQTKGAK